MILPRQLRAARADLMLTLDDVSGATGIAKTTISDMDLSRFDAAPLIAFTATKETDYGTETDGRIPC